MKQQSDVFTTPPLVADFSAIICNASSASLAPATANSSSWSNNSETLFWETSCSLSLTEALALRNFNWQGRSKELLQMRGRRETLPLLWFAGNLRRAEGGCTKPEKQGVHKVRVIAESERTVQRRAPSVDPFALETIRNGRWLVGKCRPRILSACAPGHTQCQTDSVVRVFGRWILFLFT